MTSAYLKWIMKNTMDRNCLRIWIFRVHPGVLVVLFKCKFVIYACYCDTLSVLVSFLGFANKNVNRLLFLTFYLTPSVFSCFLLKGNLLTFMCFTVYISSKHDKIHFIYQTSFNYYYGNAFYLLFHLYGQTFIIIFYSTCHVFTLTYNWNCL